MREGSLQFILLEFPFIDSQLYDEWDARGMKLYWKMRRYVCRSNNHRLAGYWQRGYLAVEGFQGTWADMMGLSQPMISKLLRWMEDKNIIVCAHKSRTAGDPNVYILGKVIHIEGSNKTEEIFLLDHHYESQREGPKRFSDDTSQLPSVTAPEVKEVNVPLRWKPHNLIEEVQAYPLDNKTYSEDNKTYSGGKRSNIEDRILEDRILTTGHTPPVKEIPTTFLEWKEKVQRSENKVGVLRWMAASLYGEGALEEGYGLAAATVRSHAPGYIAGLLWENAARPPNGDPFRYVLGILKRKEPDDGLDEFDQARMQCH